MGCTVFQPIVPGYEVNTDPWLVMILKMYQNRWQVATGKVPQERQPANGFDFWYIFKMITSRGLVFTSYPRCHGKKNSDRKSIQTGVEKSWSARKKDFTGFEFLNRVIKRFKMSDYTIEIDVSEQILQSNFNQPFLVNHEIFIWALKLWND